MFKDNVRWTIVLWLFLIGVLAYMDRSNFSVSVPLIMKEFALDPVQIGLIMSGFTIGYTILNFPGGFIAHKYGGRKVLTWIVLVWSLMTIATGFAWSFMSLIIIRIIFGMCEGPHFPATAKLTDMWVRPAERGTATGLWVAALPCGVIFGNILCSWIASEWGWRAVFYSTGLAGLIVTYLSWVILRDKPEEHSWVSKGEADMIAKSQNQKQAAANNASGMTALQVIMNPWSWVISLIFFAAGLSFWGNLNWLPTYFMKARGYNLIKSGFMASIPWVLFFAGSLIAGWLSDKGKKGRAPWLMAFLIIQVPCIAYAVYTPDTTYSLIAFCISLFCVSGVISLNWTILFEVFDRVDGAKVGGMMLTLSSLAGIIAPTLVGYVLKETGSFNIAYYVFAGFAFIGFLLSIPLLIKERTRRSLLAREQAA